MGVARKPLAHDDLDLLELIVSAAPEPFYFLTPSTIDPGSTRRNRLRAYGLARAYRASYGRWAWELTPAGRNLLKETRA